jgi:hypothetical protein
VDFKTGFLRIFFWRFIEVKGTMTTIEMPRLNFLEKKRGRRRTERQLQLVLIFLHVNNVNPEIVNDPKTTHE